MPLPPFLSAIVGWLRAGYPEGVPETDYIPLFALLSKQLSDEEVAAIADVLASNGSTDSAQAIRSAISEVTRTDASDSDVSRVRARLAAGGWPLENPDRLRTSN